MGSGSDAERDRAEERVARGTLCRAPILFCAERGVAFEAEGRIAPLRGAVRGFFCACRIVGARFMIVFRRRRRRSPFLIGCWFLDTKPRGRIIANQLPSPSVL